jgi:hypothetical protein
VTKISILLNYIKVLVGRTMDKKITTIYVNKDIKEFCKDNKINLSDWINTEFTDKFLSAGFKVKLIEEKSREIEKLKEEVKQIRERRDELKTTLSEREIKGICSCVARRSKGFNLNSMCNFFNDEYKRTFTIDEFVGLLDLYDTKAKERTAYAMNKCKRR